MATAFACRSITRSVFRMRWTANRFLLAAVAIEFLLLACFLGIPAIADLLDQAPPTTAGWTVALLTPVAVLTVDALDKRMRRERPFAPAPDRRDATSSSYG